MLDTNAGRTIQIFLVSSSSTEPRRGWSWPLSKAGRGAFWSSEMRPYRSSYVAPRLRNLEIVLPVVGIDLLKPSAARTVPTMDTAAQHERECQTPIFVIDHKGGAMARAVEIGDEFVVLAGSTALKDPGYQSNTYRSLRTSLIEQALLVPNQAGNLYEFKNNVPFKSPSAAAAVILDRNSNGRIEWKVEGKKQTYDDWQRSLTKGSPIER